MNEQEKIQREGLQRASDQLRRAFGMPRKPMSPPVSKSRKSSVEVKMNDGSWGGYLRTFNQAKAELAANGITFENDEELAAALLKGVRTDTAVFVSIYKGDVIPPTYCA